MLNCKPVIATSVAPATALVKAEVSSASTSNAADVSSTGPRDAVPFFDFFSFLAAGLFFNFFIASTTSAVAASTSFNSTCLLSKRPATVSYVALT